MDTNQVPQQILEQIIKQVVKSAVKEVTDQLTQQPIPNVANDDNFLSAEQAAQFLKIKLNTVYSKVEKGELPHYRSGKRKLLFAKKELEEFIATRRGKTTKEISDEADTYIIKKK